MMSIAAVSDGRSFYGPTPLLTARGHKRPTGRRTK